MNLPARKPLVGTANLLAGQTVALAEAFLDNRSRPEIIADRTIYLFADLKRLRGMQGDLPTSSIIDAAYMLAIALRNATLSGITATDAFAWARTDRWRQAVASLAEHVRKESLALKDEGHLA